MIWSWKFGTNFVAVFVLMYALAVLLRCLNRLYETRSLQTVCQELKPIVFQTLLIVVVVMISSAFYLWMGWSLNSQRH